MPIKFTQKWVDSSLSGSEKISRRDEKRQHAAKEPFFSLFLQQNKKVLRIKKN